MWLTEMILRRLRVSWPMWKSFSVIKGGSSAKTGEVTKARLVLLFFTMVPRRSRVESFFFQLIVNVLDLINRNIIRSFFNSSLTFSLLKQHWYVLFVLWVKLTLVGHLSRGLNTFPNTCINQSASLLIF